MHTRNHTIPVLVKLTLALVASILPVKSYCHDIEGDETIYDLYLDNLERDRDKAMEICEIYLSGIDSTGGNLLTASLCDSLAQWWGEEKFQFTKAIDWMEKALHIYDKKNIPREMANMKYKLARMYLKLGQYHKTLAYAYEAANYYEDKHDIARALDCYNLLGIVFHICMDFNQSSSYFSKVAKGAREINDTARLAGALNNSALLAVTLGDSLKAENMAVESIRLSRAINDTSLICQCYLNIASQYIGRGMLSKAEESLHHAEDFIDNIDMAGDCHRIWGMLHISQGDTQAAAGQLEKAVQYYAEGEFYAKRLFCLNMLYTIYEENGAWRKAYEALREYHRLDKASSDKNVYYELFKTQNGIILKDERQKLQEAKTEQLLGGISALFVLTVSTLVIWYTFKRKKMHISQKEAEIQNQKLLNEKNKQEISSKKEILEIKQMQQYKIDKIIEEVMEKLDKLSASIGNGAAKDEINLLCNDLKNTRDENSWKEISLYVPEFNSDLFNDIIKSFPNLTVNERRLLALLNMNMTTKDIAKITMQTPHSINIARYRLRTKLGLTGSEKTIQEFLSEYKKKEI